MTESDQERFDHEQRQRACVDLFFKCAPHLTEEEKAHLSFELGLSGLEKIWLQIYGEKQMQHRLEQIAEIKTDFDNFI